MGSNSIGRSIPCARHRAVHLDDRVLEHQLHLLLVLRVRGGVHRALRRRRRLLWRRLLLRLVLLVAGGDDDLHLS